AERTFVANKRLNELNSIGKVELDVSESEVSKARAEVSLMTVSLEKCQVAAPFAGRVAEQRVREQQYVQPGQPLLDIIDDSVLELEFIVPSHWLAWLKPGYAFQVRIDETGKSYPAKVLRLGARVDPVSQSVKTVAAIDGNFRELMAGMSGKVTVAAPTGQN
ncbi:efflux RND transporter periplasmic adaptor subunit, partial [Noviherbaspirillum sp.]|uniref:efflux RND transporter periplasmic adaptor subunit n=1 Tax=Noviherbaspirillum sp. TaxID=1926288 RepID=UPI002D3CDF7B